MKKLLYVLLVLVALFGVTGCGKKEPVKTTLTSENFEEYFTIDAQVSDFKVDERKSLTGNGYVGDANLKITVTPKKSFTTENIIIKGKVTYGGYCWAGNIDSFEIVVDMNGKGEVQKSVTTDVCYFWSPDTPTISKFYTATYELQNNEFLVRDDKFVITSLEGSVIEEQ